MILSKALKLARELMNEHGLHKWRLIIDRNTEADLRMGQCRYADMEIGLSDWFILLNDRRIVKIIVLHEIAHALTYLKWGTGGHGPRWQSMCREVGIKPHKMQSPFRIVALQNGVPVRGWRVMHHVHVKVQCALNASLKSTTITPRERRIIQAFLSRLRKPKLTTK